MCGGRKIRFDSVTYIDSSKTVKKRRMIVMNERIKVNERGRKEIERRNLEVRG